MQARIVIATIVALIIVWITTPLPSIILGFIIHSANSTQDGQDEIDGLVDAVTNKENGWYLGRSGESCAKTCNDKSLTCRQDTVDWQGWDSEKVSEYFVQAGFPCDLMKTDCTKEDKYGRNFCKNWGAPYIHKDKLYEKKGWRSHDCQISTQAKGAADCSTTMNQHQRLCFCK